MKDAPENGNPGRRTFLKGTAAAAGAAIAAGTQFAQAAEIGRASCRERV